MDQQPSQAGSDGQSSPPRYGRLARRVCLVVCLLAVPIALTFCVGSPLYYSGKYSGSLPAHPTVMPGPIEPEQQTEPHTCGLHALSSLYKAYGLDPERQQLRFRLGVDKPLNNLVPSSRGSIHPDMLRVLEQDGFDCALLLQNNEDNLLRLTDHLDAGHLAVALTKVNEFHWVVLCGIQGDDVRVCDSLKPEIAVEPMRAFVDERTYTLMLVRPR